MGKAENIKRAKRLREAKRKREQEALVAAGLGPASKKLQERNAEKGIKVQLNTGKVKYSELLKEFVLPIVSPKDDISIIRKKYSFGAVVWNVAVLKEESEEIYQSVKKDVIENLPDDPRGRELFDELEKRKLEKFSEYKNIIADLEIEKIKGGDYDITVATVPLKYSS
jgi:hypothetical protein